MTGWLTYIAAVLILAHFLREPDEPEMPEAKVRRG